MTMQAIKKTQSGCSYFEGTGAYQQEYDELWEKHVPLSGMAKTRNGELIRAIGRLTYEYFNNGNINAREDHFHTEEFACPSCHGTGTVEDEDEDGNVIEVDCSDCGGSGYFAEEVEDESTISPMYDAFIRLIDESVPGISGTMEMVADVIYASHPQSADSLFAPWKVGYYSEMADRVVAYVLATPDTEIPEWYVKEME